MSEQHLLLTGAFFIGLALGIIGMLVFNKLRGGSVSPGALKQEMEDYQEQVEAHFEQTSQKFQQMATQYQDLYQHLAVGATSLCRPENISPGLADQSDPLGKNKLIEQAPTESETQANDQEPAASTDKAPAANTDKAPTASLGKEPTIEQNSSDVKEKTEKPAQQTPDTEADNRAKVNEGDKNA